MKKTNAAFTLIELLVVIAILLILIGIALPNYMESMVRSRVTKARSELRLLDQMLMAYRLTHNRLPDPLPSDMEATNLAARLRPLTTPVKLLASIPQDPFGHSWNNGAGWIRFDHQPGGQGYCYGRADKAGPRGTLNLGDTHFMLTSAGPDAQFNQIHYYPPSVEVGGTVVCPVCDAATAGALRITIYTPTNGVSSRGDIYRWNATGLPPGMM